MPKSHRPYPPELRDRMLELVRKGRTPEELSRQFEPSAQAIRNWIRQADRDSGAPPRRADDGGARGRFEAKMKVLSELAAVPGGQGQL